MKKLIVAAALAASFAAQAGVIAWIPNKAQGRIMLMDTRGSCGQGEYQAMIVGENNSTTAGCWTQIETGPGSTLVSVLWDTGRRSTYGDDAWYITTYGRTNGWAKTGQRPVDMPSI